MAQMVWEAFFGSLDIAVVEVDGVTEDGRLIPSLHPDQRDAVSEYLDRAPARASGEHTPHLPDEALSWHARYLTRGTTTAP